MRGYEVNSASPGFRRSAFFSWGTFLFRLIKRNFGICAGGSERAAGAVQAAEISGSLVWPAQLSEISGSPSQSRQRRSPGLRVSGSLVWPAQLSEISGSLSIKFAYINRKRFIIQKQL